MSKHIILMTVAFCLLSTLTLWAQFTEERHADMTTVSVAQEAVDDSRVSLTGTILRQVGEERYLFQDATGTIIVEIDHEDWGNVTVNPEMILRISGEIDRERLTSDVEVERIEAGNVSSQDMSPIPQSQSYKINPINGVKSSSWNVSQFHLH